MSTDGARRGPTWSMSVATRPRGRRRQRTKGGFATRKAAEQALAEVIRDFGQGTYAAAIPRRSPSGSSAGSPRWHRRSAPLPCATTSRASLADAERFGLVQRNVAALVKAPSPQREELRTWWVDGDLVFCDEAGRELQPDRFSRAFNSATKRAGVPPIRLHDLRHTWATLVLQAGIPQGRERATRARHDGDHPRRVPPLQPEMDAHAAAEVAKLFA